MNEREESFETTKKLWALGNWSKFVQGGAIRIACGPDGSTIGPITGRWETSASLDLGLLQAPSDGIIRLPGGSVTTLLIAPSR